MPYKRAESPYYQIRKWNLAGYGNLGPLSTRTRKKDIARRMEDVLEEVAEKGLVDPSWHDLLDAVKSGAVDLPTLLRAKNNRALDALKSTLRDPALAEVVQRFEELIDVEQGTRNGLTHLLHYAPRGARFSYLRAPRNVTALCRAAEADGRKRNTVRRTLYRAISHLLREEYGSAERDRILSDIRFYPLRHPVLGGGRYAGGLPHRRGPPPSARVV